jgi:hypothetical protein
MQATSQMSLTAECAHCADPFTRNLQQKNRYLKLKKIALRLGGDNARLSIKMS